MTTTIGKIGARGASTLLLATALAALVACGDSPTTQQALPPAPTKMDIIAGNSQSALAGTEVAQPVVVRVLDSAGKPIVKQIVNFHVTKGGGSVFAGTALTNADGLAQERWTLGPTAGSAQALEARAINTSSGEKQVFAAFAATALSAATATASVTVTPASASNVVGTTRQLAAVAKNAAGATISAKTFVWKSGNTTVATVSTTGLVTARTTGSTAISASVDGKTGQVTIAVTAPVSSTLANECATRKAGWIWCDDFEQNRLGSYFEYDSQNNSFARANSTGMEGSVGMRARFAQGQVNAGNLKLAFGRTPSSYMDPVDAGRANYRELYIRFYFKNSSNWRGGGGDKLMRAVSFAGSNWSEAMLAHIWSGGSNHNYLGMDPASGTDAQGKVLTTGYNDFDHLRWLGHKVGTTPIFDASHVGKWYCVESHIRLNTAGQNNGVFEYWIDGRTEASTSGLNWVGGYNAYGINTLMLENYWNNGSPQAQERFFDNLVVSTRRIGCS